MAHAQQILAANEGLHRLSIGLTKQVESRLTFVLSDIYQPTHHETLLNHFAECYPFIEFESLIAEEEDVMDLIKRGRAHIGMVEVQHYYSPEIGVARLPKETAMGLFILKEHPLAQVSPVLSSDLLTVRQLCLNTYLRVEPKQSHGLIWSAPNYLMLLEMAEQGFGWAILPRWLVNHYGKNRLVELTTQSWPKMISVDAIWSKKTPPGPAGFWLLEQLLNG